MSDQLPFNPEQDAWVATVADRFRAGRRPGRLWLMADAAWRLGARPVGLMLLHRASLAAGLPQRRLADAAAPAGVFLPVITPPAPPLPAAAAARVLEGARALPARPDWHGGYDPAAPAIGQDLFAAGDIRPVWEASRFADVLLLAQAARIDPGGGHLAQAEARLAAWCAANPAFRGPAWACGQEAALRALSLALALALLDADRDPPPAARALLALCARRIAATPAYAAAQDNNHAISEPAGAFACALLRRDRAGADRAARHLASAVARLVAPDGGFAQVSAGYARLALDVLSVVEWLRRRHGAPAFPAPLTARAAALAGWLHRVVAPEDGSGPALGVEDGSAFADLGLHGPVDARGSTERAARLFAGAGADLPQDAGCIWLGLALPASRLPRPARWRAAGSQGWAAGGATGLLRTGPLRFRPSQPDLLHFTLRDGPRMVLRDGGTGAYNPAAPWWWQALASGAAHNAVLFDEAEPMPRLGRFLFARWPRLRDLPDGAARRDAAGPRHARRVQVRGRCWTVTDHLAGRFGVATLRWRLPDGDWRLHGDMAEDGRLQLRIEADAPRGALSLAMERGWHSPAYGAIAPCPVLCVTARAPVARLVTTITLPTREPA
ncbi:heparinase II/III family protein [Falsiroseomonas sp.]|uniref:heparinase II/III domain-containing protein n=1 Tax=Falsiroseomonas sp. TaxID=2870721 RepID=UPI0027363850|nr:heparinase II/III family protein [Falsiroseomonas sp.]MDP3418849.1 heparinase II/III family protein [Falsiroseomonas sp.]